MEEGNIGLGSMGMGIGKVSLDPTEIRGEGGEHDPRLVIPIKIVMYQNAREHQLVITRLSASLHLNRPPDPGNQFASRVSYDLIYNMPIASHIGISESQLELRFNLTHPQIKALEYMRHQTDKNLYLRLDPIIVWNMHTGNAVEHTN